MRWSGLLLAIVALTGLTPAAAQMAPPAPVVVAVGPVVGPPPTVGGAELAPPQPDYAQPGSWAAGPFGPGATAALPAGASPAARRAPVDVFYVHPTTVRSDTLLNQDIGDAVSNRWTDESAVARQGSAFNGCCRVFAPRYRAATYKAFISPAVQAKAFALAYTDVERAFDWYLAHENHGRPFIIVGHSQGAFHIATLLEKRIDGTPLQRQLVAAYIIGIVLGEGEFGLRFHHVGICQTPTATGCAVQWNAVLASTDLAVATARARQPFVNKYGDVPGKMTLCVNPLTFDRRRPSALASAARGAVPGQPEFGAMLPLRRGAVAAHCDQGLLVVQPDAALGLEPLTGGVMHYHDIGLFYADVRANAAARVQAFLAQHRRPR